MEFDNKDERPMKKLNETVELSRYDLRNEKEYVEELAGTLMALNITPMYKGFNYIIDAIRILNRNRYTHLLITKDIYIPVADLYETTPELVEHGMRTAIKRGWQKTKDRKYKEKIFPSIDKCPSNYAFLVIVSNYVGERIKG
ncbi:MAG: hypothetical protein KBS68_07835 [Clostridiales bacterium]|nr:hypothetical protein [Candidatus Crickella merdequi]